MNNDQAKEYGQMLSLRGNLPGRFNQFYDFVEVTAATLNDLSNKMNFKEKALPIVKNVVMFIKYCTTILPLDVGNNMDNIATDVVKDLAGTILGDRWADFLLKDFKVSIAKDTVAYVQAILGGAFLNFIPDDYNVALHSQPETWQRAFGYNELYDLVLPMQVSLYNYDKDKKCFTDNIFNWFPNREQWWGTGFNWHYQNPDKDDMFVIGVVDLSQYTNIYHKFKEEEDNHSLIFDDHTEKIWIPWYDEKINSNY